MKDDEINKKNKKNHELLLQPLLGTEEVAGEPEKSWKKEAPSKRVTVDWCLQTFLTVFCAVCCLAFGFCLWYIDWMLGYYLGTFLSVFCSGGMLPYCLVRYRLLRKHGKPVEMFVRPCKGNARKSKTPYEYHYKFDGNLYRRSKSCGVFFAFAHVVHPKFPERPRRPLDEILCASVFTTSVSFPSLTKACGLLMDGNNVELAQFAAVHTIVFLAMFTEVSRIMEETEPWTNKHAEIGAFEPVPKKEKDSYFEDDSTTALKVV